jgi:hypothetical protein
MFLIARTGHQLKQEKTQVTPCSHDINMNQIYINKVGYKSKTPKVSQLQILSEHCYSENNIFYTYKLMYTIDVVTCMISQLLNVRIGGHQTVVK